MAPNRGRGSRGGFPGEDSCGLLLPAAVSAPSESSSAPPASAASTKARTCAARLAKRTKPLAADRKHCGVRWGTAISSAAAVSSKAADGPRPWCRKNDDGWPCSSASAAATTSVSATKRRRRLTPAPPLRSYAAWAAPAEDKGEERG